MVRFLFSPDTCMYGSVYIHVVTRTNSCENEVVGGCEAR